MFLKELKRIHQGYRPQDDYTINIYSGVSHRDKAYVVAWVHGPQESSILIKLVDPALFEKEESFLISQLKKMYSSWIVQDYTIFDSNLQAEEAAQVRGMLIFDPEAEEAVKRIIDNYEVADSTP